MYAEARVTVLTDGSYAITSLVRTSDGRDRRFSAVILAGRRRGAIKAVGRGHDAGRTHYSRGNVNRSWRRRARLSPAPPAAAMGTRG